MSFTSAQLASEINNDPDALGYAAQKTAKSYSGITSILNATHTGAGTVFRNDVRSSEVLAALVWSELGTLTTNNWLALNAILQPGTVDATLPTIRALFSGLFPAATFVNTNANLTALAKKANPTRAEELWGYATVIADQDVATALGGLT